MAGVGRDPGDLLPLTPAVLHVLLATLLGYFFVENLVYRP
jgi:hypothetical protein